MKSQKIRTRPENTSHKFELSGWLSGRQSCLWFGIDGGCVGTLAGQKLYRLAKAIVKHYEGK
jgi:hypothetical protein